MTDHCTAPPWVQIELEFTAQRRYVAPNLDVDLNLTCVGPRGRRLRLAAF